MRLPLLCLAAAFTLACSCSTAVAAPAWPEGVAVVGYQTSADLERVLAELGGQVEEQIPELRVAAVRPDGSLRAWASSASGAPGIRFVEPQEPREAQVEPGLLSLPGFDREPAQWAYSTVHADRIPESVLRAAASITIAVLDTGGDLAAPDLTAKAPATHSVLTGDGDVADRNGHGTFVAALAAGSRTNGEGIAGLGGDARLLIVRVASDDGVFTDVDEAAGIVYAVDQGARIINLSLAGDQPSTTERLAVEYAVSRGALLVAAAGNEFENGNPVLYPAALLQSLGSNGIGGAGLAVAASTADGRRAPFSSTGSWVSLAAPGEAVLSAVSSLSAPDHYPRVRLAGSSAGVYGYGSGTSFAAPQVAGAAALVWAADPSLTATGVAEILKRTASRAGTGWSEELGWGVIDVAAAVASAMRVDSVGPTVRLTGRRIGGRILLSWNGDDVAQDGIAASGVGGYRVEILAGRVRTSRSLSASVTSLSLRLERGRRYVFRVVATDRSGNQSTPSAAVRARLN